MMKFYQRIRNKKRKQSHQEPSFLSNLLIGDVDVCGHIEIQIPRATDRVIHIDISTHSTHETSMPMPSDHKWVDGVCINFDHEGLQCQQ